MKTNAPALAFLAAILPLCAHAQGLPELPSLGAVKAQLAGSDPADSAAVAAGASATKPLAKACLPWMATATVKRGVFESDYTVEVNGSKVGEIEERGSSLVLVNNAGQIDAEAKLSGDPSSKQQATVTTCNGAATGQIEELSTSDQVAYNIKDAAGTPLMTTGWGSSGDLAASAPTASMKVVQNGIFDNFTVTIHGSPMTVGLFTAVMNNKAAYRRSRERQRERIGDRPGRDR